MAEGPELGKGRHGIWEGETEKRPSGTGGGGTAGSRMQKGSDQSSVLRR